MEENEGNMVRIRLSFDDRHLLHKSQLLQGLRHCWLLLKPDIINISDLVSEISERFCLRHHIVLLIDDFVLPSFESTCLITDKDIIRVKKEEAKQKDIIKLSKDGKPQEILQESQSYDNEILASCMKNPIHIDPLGDVGSSKRKRKHSKKLLDSRVKNEEAKQKDIIKIYKDDKPQENLQGSGNYDNEILTSCMTNSIHVDSLGDAGSSKRKRKYSKKLLDSRGQSKEMNQDNQFEPRNNSDVGKIPILFDGGSNTKEPYTKDDTFPQTSSNDKCFKVDSAPIFQGILPLPKPEVMPSTVDITKPRKYVIHFEILLHLIRLPMIGDILAYRYVESSSVVHAHLSTPQVGEVSSFDYKTLQIILLPVLDYVLVLNGNPNENIGQPNASLYKEDGSLEIGYLSLVDVRLVKASQDDHAMKDKWEEALLQGNWNEPNAFTTAQSNTWAPWYPNKSASTMSSFKQPNAPFAGRGTGRINLASNRSMNNRIPNMNTTNWNPNSNNAARNQNKSNIIFTAMYNTATLPWSYRASGLPNPRHKF